MALFSESRVLVTSCTTSLTVNDQFFLVVMFNALHKFELNILECDLQSPHVIITESKSTSHLYGKPGNSGENSNGTVHPGGILPEEPNLSRYYLFPVSTETTEFSVPFVWITSARLHVERKRKIYRYFVNNTTQSRKKTRTI